MTYHTFSESQEQYPNDTILTISTTFIDDILDEFWYPIKDQLSKFESNLDSLEQSLTASIKVLRDLMTSYRQQTQMNDAFILYVLLQVFLVRILILICDMGVCFTQTQSPIPPLYHYSIQTVDQHWYPVHICLTVFVSWMY